MSRAAAHGVHIRSWHTAAVTPWQWVRAGLVAGLSALAAVFAHAGPAGLTETRWLLAAAAGAGAAAAALTVAAAWVARINLVAGRLERGSVAGSIHQPVRRVSFPHIVAAMLVCQGAAHLTLLAAGVHAAGGPAGSLTLHALLAVAAAAVVSAFEHLAARSAGRLERAIGAALAALRKLSPPQWPVLGRPFAAPVPREVRGRAPPVRA